MFLVVRLYAQRCQLLSIYKYYFYVHYRAQPASDSTESTYMTIHVGKYSKSKNRLAAPRFGPKELYEEIFVHVYLTYIARKFTYRLTGPRRICD